MKIFVWNINQRSSGQEIPPFVSKEIIKANNADIVVLTEFISATNEIRIQNVHEFFNIETDDNNLRKKYDCYYNIDRKDDNGILIAIKKDFAKKKDIRRISKIEKINSMRTEQPNFLQLDIVIDGELMSIIGTRTRVTGYVERREQILSLIEHINTLTYEKIIVAGDFNNSKICGDENKRYADVRENYHYTSMKTISDLFDTYNYHILKDDFYNYAGMDVSTPKSEPNKPTWSWVDKYRNKYKQDHIISRGVNVSATEYVWDFVNKDNGYSGKNPQDYKSSLVGYPDHAILTANVELLDINSKEYAENHRKKENAET